MNEIGGKQRHQKLTFNNTVGRFVLLHWSLNSEAYHSCLNSKTDNINRNMNTCDSSVSLTSPRELQEPFYRVILFPNSVHIFIHKSLDV